MGEGNKKDKLLKNVTVCLALFFFLFIIISFLDMAKKEEDYLKNYNYIIQSTNDFNDQLNKGSSDNQVSVKAETPLYDNGKEAILTAYQKFLNCKTMKVKMSGSLNIDAVGGFYSMHLIVDADSEKRIDKTTQTVCVYESSSSSRNSASYSEKIGDICYRKETKSVSKSGDSLYGHFGSAQYINLPKDEFKAQYGTIPGEIFYIVNSSTLKTIMSYNIHKTYTGNISSYEVKVRMDTVASTVDYKTLLARSMKPVNGIHFTSVIATVLIDAKGNLKTIKFDEQYYFNTKVVGAIETTAQVSSILTVEILNVEY